jgi:hypothetical protein
VYSKHVTVEEIMFNLFSKKDVKVMCNALSINLQADNLASWIKVNEGTLITQLLHEEDITVSVKNGKTTDEPGASDTESNSEWC